MSCMVPAPRISGQIKLSQGFPSQEHVSFPALLMFLGGFFFMVANCRVKK